MKTAPLPQQQQQQQPPAKQMRLLPANEASKLVKSAWHKVCLAHAAERPTREILVLRNALNAVSTSEPLEELLGEQILLDISQLDSLGFKFSHLLFAALDFDLGRRALKRIFQQAGEDSKSVLVLTSLEQSMSTLVAFLFAPEQEISSTYLERLRDLDRALECVSKLDTAFDITGRAPGIASLVEQILLQYSHSKQGVKFLRTACLALYHVKAREQQNEFAKQCSRLVQSALLFAQVSLSPQDNHASWLDDIAPLLSYSLEAEEDVDCVMLALEALCAWATHCGNSHADEVQRAFALCLPFADHLTLATLSLNTYEKLLASCVKRDFQQVLLGNIGALTLQLQQPKQLGRGFYLMLEKFIKAVGAMRVMKWNANLVVLLLGKKSHQEVTGNGICNCLCALFKSWLVEIKYKVTREVKGEFVHIAKELESGPEDVFTNFHIVRRFLNDFFGEFQCPEEARANREIGVFLLGELGRGHDWARYNVLLALERGGIHIGIGSNSPLQLSKQELEQGLRSESVEIRQTIWALVSTRVKKSKFPSKVVLDAVLGAFQVMIKFDCNPLKTSLERLFDRVLLLLQTPGKKQQHAQAAAEENENEEEYREYCALFLLDCSTVIAKQFYIGAPLNALALPLELTAQLLQGGKKLDARLQERLLAPLTCAGTVRVLLHYLLHSSFDVLRMQVYTVLSSLGKLEGLSTVEEMNQFLAEYVHDAKPKARRECDAIALLLRLFHNKFCLEANEYVRLSPSNSSEDVRFMRLALQEAKRCVTVDTAYNVGCVICSKQGGLVLATGFSREMEGNTHAEEVALVKLNDMVREPSTEEELTLYTTMEPCSLRLSGKECCASRILASAAMHKITRVVVGVNEPDLFVEKCEGIDMLRARGIQVERVDDSVLAQECLAVSTGHALTASQVLVAELVRNLQTLHEPVLSLVTLRYVLRDLSTGAKQQQQQQQRAFALLPVLLRCVEHGAQQMVENGGDDFEDDDEEAVDSAWLIVREGSEALTELLERALSANDNANAGKEEEAVTIKCCNWFLDTALQLKHSGAMTYVTKGLERVTKLLLRSPALQNVVIKQWLPRLFVQIRNEREFDKAIRRNEGFCFCFRAILRASELSKRGDVIQLVCQQLIFLEQDKQAAHLNILKALFEDAVSARALTAYLSPSIQLAVEGFGSPEWKIRSASLSLMVSLLKRIVGDQPSKTCVSVNSFDAVFKAYPSLVAVITRELQLAVDAPSSSQLALYPLLLFLSSMKLGESTEHGALTALVAQICQQHPVFQIRAIAARAWAVFEPEPTQFLQAEGENALHGFLMYVRETGGGERFARECNAVLLAGAAKHSFIVRELALELVPASMLDLSWLDSVVQGILMDEAPADGALVGRTRFYTLALKLFVQHSVRARQFDRLIEVLTALLQRQSGERGLAAFEQLCESAKGVEREMQALVPVLFAHCRESEHVEALAALLQHQPQERAMDICDLPVASLIALLDAKPRNVRLQAAGLCVLSCVAGGETVYFSRLQAATKHTALEMRLASAWCVGNRKNDLQTLISALYLLADEDEQVRETARARISLLGQCASAEFQACWAEITNRFGGNADNAWRNQLVEWVFAESKVLTPVEAEDDLEQPAEHWEVRLWIELASMELERVKQMQLANGGDEQYFRTLAVRALHRLKLCMSNGDALSLHLALCAVLAVGDGFSTELANAVRECCREHQPEHFPLSLQLRAQDARRKFWGWNIT